MQETYLVNLVCFCIIIEVTSSYAAPTNYNLSARHWLVRCIVSPFLPRYQLQYKIKDIRNDIIKKRLKFDPRGQLMVVLIDGIKE